DIRLGDSLTVSVFGREVTARVAVIRRVEFGAFGASFPLVFTPNTFEGAIARQVAIAKASRAQEAQITRALGAAFPEVNVISVRGLLAAFQALSRRPAPALRAE